jgi:hypothetical protein
MDHIIVTAREESTYGGDGSWDEMIDSGYGKQADLVLKQRRLLPHCANDHEFDLIRKSSSLIIEGSMVRILRSLFKRYSEHEDDDEGEAEGDSNLLTVFLLFLDPASVYRIVCSAVCNFRF